MLPDSPGYDSARKAPITRFDELRPRAIVFCRNPQDVSQTILCARRSRLGTAVRSGGHSFAGHSSTKGILIDVTPMDSVSVSDGVATVGAGARLGDVYDSLDEHGLTIPAGCGPSVGIAGLTLGGGFGILGRKHGLTSDHMLGAQVVLADGRVVDCDEHHHEELFWALRGAGGGNFGVVTSFTFDTLAAPHATTFHLVWSRPQAAAVVEAWQAWSPVGPDELSASLLLTAQADRDQPPLIHLFGAMAGSDSDTAGLLQGLVDRVGADPESASRRHSTHHATKRYLAENGPGEDQIAESSQRQGSQESIILSKSEFFSRPLPLEPIEALIKNFTRGRRPGQARELDFLPWGGAYNRVPGGATAFAHRRELFSLKHSVLVRPNASMVERENAHNWVTQSWASVHPWGSGGVYPNFPDPDLADWAHAYYGTNLDRLVRVKKRYDPNDFFRFEQSVPTQMPSRNEPASEPPLLPVRAP